MADPVARLVTWSLIVALDLGAVAAVYALAQLLCQLRGY